MVIVYFPCKKNGSILKGFCPCVGDVTSLIKDVANYRKFNKMFNIRYYSFGLYDKFEGVVLLDKH